jgi:hypothetical protein
MKGEKHMGNIFKAFKVMAVVLDWFETAMQDGKIDINEAATLIRAIGDILDIETSVNLDPGGLN